MSTSHRSPAIASSSSAALPIVVVGGGLAGLAAAARTATAGHPTVLIEKSSVPGGRGVTHVKHGFHFNLGPHALYRGGPAERALRSLGVVPKGGKPPVSGGHAVADGRLHALPGGAVSLLTTSLLGAGAKLEAGRLLGSLGRIDADAFDRASVDEWLAGAVRHSRVRELVQALFRLSTYVHAPSTMSAGVAIRQFQGALASGVTYLDGGWQTLVDQLRIVAEQAGARIATGSRVVEVSDDGGVISIRLADGSVHAAAAVVLATDPATTLEVLGAAASPTLAAFGREAIPVRAACLDVALRGLPRPRSTFALGIDRPLYLSVHSTAARLAPDGGAVLHAAVYLGDDARGDAAGLERELEALLDLVQPGWRERVEHKRFLPNMTVVHAIPTAAMGGLAGRPAEDASGLAGVFLCGDWIGSEGFLADASFASAMRGADLALARAGMQRAAA